VLGLIGYHLRPRFEVGRQKSGGQGARRGCSATMAGMCRCAPTENRGPESLDSQETLMWLTFTQMGG